MFTEYKQISRYDVVVAGAGVAGIAAAIAAARRGMKTALIEKQTLIGGLATSGLIYIYLPLCDGRGTQVIKVISEEMIKRCPDYGPFDQHPNWGGPEDGYTGSASDRYRCCFSPAGFTLSLDKMLAEAGVDLWLDTVITGVVCEDSTVKAVDVFNSSGRMRIPAGAFVDASGGAYLLQMAGHPVRREDNFLTPWVMEVAEDPSFFHFTESLHIEGNWKSMPADLPNAVAHREVFSDCSTGKNVTDFIRRSWELVRYRYQDVDRKKNYPVHLPAMPQFRKIAAACCRTMLDENQWQRFEDSIGLSGDWRGSTDVWETPFGALVPEGIDGIFAAGRCMGAVGQAWEVYRVIPTAAMTGEAAGIAAALTVEQNIPSRQLPYQTVQTELRKLQIPLHIDEVGLEQYYLKK